MYTIVAQYIYKEALSMYATASASNVLTAVEKKRCKKLHRVL